MKRELALFMSVIMAALSTGNIYAGNKDYADREYVISQFVQAVGRNKFSNKHYDLSKFKDSGDIDVEFKDDVEIAVANNIVSGYEDETIKPDNNITRAEAAVILSKCLGNVEITETEKQFTDVPQWALSDVNKLTQGGIINGYDEHTFGSKDNITIEQVGILVNKVESKVNKNNLKNDYYDYYNDKFKRNYSLDGNSHYDNFEKVNNLVNERIHNIISDSSDKSDANEVRINDVYNLYMDTSSRNNLGIEPLRPYIDKIKSIKSVNDIPEVEAYLYKDLYISPLFGFNANPNIEESSKNIIYINESSSIMQKDYYFSLETAESKKAYNNYVKDILTKSGVEKFDASRLYDFEKSIIQKSGTSNYSAYGTVCDRKDVNQYCENVSLDSFLNNLLGSKGSKVGIFNAEQLRQMSLSITNSNIETVKAYYIANLVTAFRDYLTEDIANSYYTFTKTLYGNSAPKIETRAIGFAKTYAGSAIISKYAEKYYNAEKEQNVINMIKEIQSYYKKMINNNSWLSNETKNEAIKKLDNISIKVGYSKNPLPYSGRIKIIPKEQGGTIMSNVISVSKVLSDYEINLVESPVDKVRWSITPLMVNACYIPTKNEILIPMAILESPFYNENADYYENLGGIGSVIAHEISHAFDPMGANYDEKGNFRDWWTEEDRNKFYDYSDKVIKYFGKYEVVNGIDNDGENTLLENVADLSGIACILEITKDKGGNLKVLMESYARLWNEIGTDDYFKGCVKTDSHSVSKIRINGVLSNLEDFYSTYGITQGDGMYVEPENRVRIW